MKNTSILFASFIFLFASCKQPETPEPIVKENQIFHYIIDESVIEKSEEVKEIDFNNDGIVDFIFESIVHVEPAMWCYTGMDSAEIANISHTYYYYYYCELSPKDSIFINSEIEYNKNVKSERSWFTKPIPSNFDYPIETTKYYGFKKYINNLPHYGWIKFENKNNEVKFVEMAINSLPNYDILAEQKE